MTLISYSPLNTHSEWVGVLQEKKIQTEMANENSKSLQQFFL